jgi:hypothetical protein
LIGFRLAIAAQQVDEADGQEISVVLSRLSAAAYLSRYSDSIRKQMRAHNKTLEPLTRGDRRELRAISGGSA